MPIQLLADYLAQRGSGIRVAEALAAVLKKHRAGNVVLSGWRCTWSRWGDDRQTDGQRQHISVAESVGLHWVREPDSDDFVLLRRDSHFERAGVIRVETYPIRRNHGWAMLAVETVPPPPAAIEVQDTTTTATDPPGPKPGRVNIKGRVRDLEPEYVKKLERPLKRGDKAQIARAIAARLREEDKNLPDTLEKTVERYLRPAPKRTRKRKADHRSP